jgi:hypothetical protein
MNPRPIRLVAALLGGILMTGTAAAQQPPTRIEIAAMPPGAPPPGFVLALTGSGAAGEWRVVTDADATAGKAIAQTGTDATDYRFPLAIYQPLSARNLEVVVRFKPVSGRVDQAGGVALRLTGKDDYYVARANALEDNVRFYRVVNGRRQQIQGADVKVAGNHWHTLGLRAEGERFTVSFDGRQLFTAEDKTFAGSGRVALWTKADSVTHFDAVSITPLD